MPKGKRRKKVSTTVEVGRNLSVMATSYPDSGIVDISYPDRSKSGFYWHHVKGLPLADARGIFECLRNLYEEGALGV